MRSRFALYTLGLTAASLVLPLAAHAAVIPFFGPIIPENNCVVGFGWGGLIVVINNIIRVLLTLAIVAVAPIMIAWAGFLLVANPFNPGAKEKAKSMLLNLALGLFVALAAWLIVDALMAAIYHPTNLPSGFGSRWSDIITSGNQSLCLGLGTSTLPPPPTGGVATGGAPLSSTGVGACNAQTLQQIANTNSLQMSNAEIAYLSCVAGPESTCGTVNQNYNWNGVRSSPPSTAYGPFQVTLKGNSSCYNNNACDAAAGLPAGTPLNCAAAFNSQGYPIQGALLQQCTTAAANLACSTAAADCVFDAQGPSAWTMDPNSATQQRCLNFSGV